MIIIPAQAGSLSISPIRVYLEDDFNLSSIKITNNSENTKLTEIKVFRWIQQDGQDILLPSDELLVTPAVFSVGAGESQTLRVGILSGVPKNKEKSFRIVISGVNTEHEGSQSVGFNLNYSLPVFYKTRNAKSQLNWTYNPDKGVLTVVNTGDSHRLVSKVTLSSPDSVSGNDWSEEGLFYVLAGASRDWKVIEFSHVSGRMPQLTVQSHPRIITREKLSIIKE